MNRDAGARFFLQEHLVSGPVFHGGVGNKDIETVLLREGWKPVHPGDHDRFSVPAKMRRLARTANWFNRLPRGATLLFQWPVYASLNRMLLRSLLRYRPDVRPVCYLTDIDGLRDGDPALLEKELAWFRRFGHFIVHNESMRAWLLARVPKAVTGKIGFFDFLAAPASELPELAPSVCFAANFSKAAFLPALAGYGGIRFHLYGERHPHLPEAANCHYEGCFPARELPGLARGSFGLVWDGESAEGLEGSLGEYNQWNSPHKLSLYILAGKPVICHERSAAASLVREYGIGIPVSGLSELEGAITALSPADYHLMQQRMQPLAARIGSGGCLRAALAELGLGG